jgi:tetratricopeptide (TPR) repeat protein
MLAMRILGGGESGKEGRGGRRRIRGRAGSDRDRPRHLDLEAGRGLRVQRVAADDRDRAGAQVESLDKIKGTLGLSDAQVRQYDALLRDYALKYDAACRDATAEPPRMNEDEYSCVRGNMDRVLDDLRLFNQAVEAVKSVGDASAHAELIRGLLADVQRAASSGYRAGCRSAMDVNPRSLHFAGRTPERSIQITNRGNRDIVYSVDGWPDGFDPRPISGSLARGATASVSLIRTVLPVPPDRPLIFHVRNNFDDQVEIELRLDDENVALWRVLGREVEERSRASGSEVSVGGAVAVVDRALAGEGEATATLHSRLPESDRFLLAASVLFEMRRDDLADQALDRVARSGPTREPTQLILRGLLASRRGQTARALEHFEAAKRRAPRDKRTRRVLDLFSTAIRVDGGDQAASAELRGAEVSGAVAENPSLAEFTARELCVKRSGSCRRQLDELALRRLPRN